MNLRFRFSFAVALALAGANAASAAAAPAVIPLEIPQPVDARLQVSLYADSSDIVTPIGAAVDARGRLFVLESHTHLPTSDYKGPKRDRVIMFEGARPDGRAARQSIFADGIMEGLNLAFSPTGTLYVVGAKTVEALPDADGDGKAEEAKVVLRLDTAQRYAHNQLLSLMFSPDGWLYVGRGNTGGTAHAWVAADGRRLEAYGNGGDVVRCRPDGTQLERVATGFWNPFALAFDRHGRLLLVDNDPDSRGPNKLVHLVPGGDYGFKSLYGGSGLHPYDGWDGDLPGTLPMIAGTGEAPSGLLDLSYGALPEDYRDTIAVTIWGEHNISLVRTQPAGVSLRGTTAPFIRGGKWFRPVAMVAAPDGTIYITDWVLKDYPVHGQGRIWKLTTRPGVAAMKPPAQFAAPASDAGSVKLAQLLKAGPGEVALLRPALSDADAFVRHAAVEALARPDMKAVATAELENADPAVRLGALLALRRAGAADAEAIVRARLRDPSLPVRQMALVWAGERELRTLKADVEAAVDVPNLAPRLFETWLATLQILNAPPSAAGARPDGMRIRRDPDPRVLERTAADAARSAAVRTIALRQLAGTAAAPNRELLLGLLASGDVGLRIEAVRSLAPLGDAKAVESFRAIAANRAEPARLRAEAIVALGAGASAALAPLVNDPDPTVAGQATRTLKVTRAGPAAPATDAAADWVKLLATGGSAEAGERVFFAATSTCLVCHRVNGRGGTIGPDLSVIARSASREQLIRSIVTPSEEIALQFQAWEIKTKSGEVVTGLQGHLRTGGGASIIPLNGRERTIAEAQLESFRALDSSLMPSGLAALFSTEEFRDLVAYLETLR